MRLPKHLSAFPSVPLQRPFRLFGKGFEVKLSSHMTPLPDTLLWAGAGMSYMQLLEAMGPDYPWAMKAMWRAVSGQNRLSGTTLANVTRLIPLGEWVELPENPTQDELLARLPEGTAWQLLEQTMRPAAGSDVYDLIQRLATLEAVCARYRELIGLGSPDEAEAMLRQQVGYPERYWQKFRLSMKGMVVIDPMMQILAQVELADITAPEAGVKASSPVLALLDEGRTPLGHWLIRQQKAAGCASLKQLSDRTNTDLDRLKDWSSGRHLLGPEKAKDLLSGLSSDIDPQLEVRRYRNARFLSFLIEFVMCSVEEPAPSWDSAQSMVRNRYRELLESAIPA